MQKSEKQPVVLCILDGVGHSERFSYNAVRQAKTPVLDRLKKVYHYAFMHCSGVYVGLPQGQMGNSEVGHSAIGLGRVILQDLPKISFAIGHEMLDINDDLTNMVTVLRKNGGTCHLWGLLSDGGVHSHQDHLFGLLNFFLKNNIKVKVHACLDGRDTPPKSAQCFIKELKKRYGGDVIGTVGGRYYGMDRDKRWGRIQRAYNQILKPSEFVDDVFQYITDCYEKEIFDEFIPPVALKGYEGVKDGDGFISFNFRSDRARQMMTALTEDFVPGMDNKLVLPKFSYIITMTEYSDSLSKKVNAIFPHEEIKNSLGEVLSEAGVTQLRAAETEKYPHVTFFFDGGKEDPFPGESRLLVNSPKVATYDLCPEMSAGELTDKIVDYLEKDSFDVYVMNFANGDMVGHTGNFEAVKKAMEFVDACVGRIFEVVQRKKGHLLIIADHGNAEDMFNEEKGLPNTAHTTNDVVFLLASDEYKDARLRAENTLIDVAPTILDILGLNAPKEMSGDSIIINKKF